MGPFDGGEGMKSPSCPGRTIKMAIANTIHMWHPLGIFYTIIGSKPRP